MKIKTSKSEVSSTQKVNQPSYKTQNRCFSIKFSLFRVSSQISYLELMKNSGFNGGRTTMLNMA